VWQTDPRTSLENRLPHRRIPSFGIFMRLSYRHSRAIHRVTKEALKAWFNASDGTHTPDDPGKWDTAGIKVEWNSDPKTGVKDFEESLQRNGAIVVYIGHSTLTTMPKGQPEGLSLGLSPENPKKGPEIPNARLRSLLSKSAASLVIIGSCDSKTAVGKITDRATNYRHKLRR
jgi:hypothetical protein